MAMTPPSRLIKVNRSLIPNGPSRRRTTRRLVGRADTALHDDSVAPSWRSLITGGTPVGSPPPALLGRFFIQAGLRPSMAALMADSVQPPMKRKVLVISAAMGAGHAGASRELARRIIDRGHSAVVVDFLDAFPARAGVAWRGFYLLQLRRFPES